jgi:hypothetical protein
MVVASKEIGLNVNADKTKYSEPLTYELNSFQRAGPNSSWS